MRVAILNGGSSLERQVSLRSGERVEDAMNTLGHDSVRIDPGPGLVRALEEARPEVVFVALHGVGGEDGTVQELLEILGLAHTGSGSAASRLAIDKPLAKSVLRASGVPTADWFSLSAAAFRGLGAAEALNRIGDQLGFPLVIKPARGGSALGVHVVVAADDLPQALIAALSYDERVVAERHVEGRELAVSILDGEVLPVVEAIPLDAGTYSYDDRYEIGRTTYECPAPLEPAELEAVETAALGTWRALGASDFARVDLILDPVAGPQVLELNTIPGLTDTSLFPMAAAGAGIDFNALCDRVIGLALRRD